MKKNNHFELVKCRVIAEIDESGRVTHEAVVKLKAKEKVIHTACEGDCAVSTLYSAFQKALEVFYPRVSEAKIMEYNEMQGKENTNAVLLSTDENEVWTVLGKSEKDTQAKIEAIAASFLHILEKENLRAKSEKH